MEAPSELLQDIIAHHVAECIDTLLGYPDSPNLVAEDSVADQVINADRVSILELSHRRVT